MTFSVIIPAHNEEGFIGSCLESIMAATRHIKDAVEIITALNRCTDSTEAIARNQNAVIVWEDSKNLARIRNAAAKVASGDVIVTIDADSRMTPNMFEEIKKHLSKGFKTLTKAHIVTSCRKFDRFGDWYLFKNPGLVRKILQGDDQKAADSFYYEVDRPK